MITISILIIKPYIINYENYINNNHYYYHDTMNLQIVAIVNES